MCDDSFFSTHDDEVDIEIYNPFKNKKHYDDDVIINPFKVNRYLLIIYNYFVNHNSFSKWSVLYDYVRARIGPKWNICLITKRELTKEQFEGRIRSIVEEHSSDSRQHYFKNGVLQPQGWRLNLFSNESLRKQNQDVQWMPYNKVRGNKWKLGGGKYVSRQVLENAAKAYRVKNRRRGKAYYDDNFFAAKAYRVKNRRRGKAYYDDNFLYFNTYA